MLIETIEMQEGQAVELRLHGGSTWYQGVVLDRPRKQWVQVEKHPAGEYIADENSIAEWRPAGDR